MERHFKGTVCVASAKMCHSSMVGLIAVPQLPQRMLFVNPMGVRAGSSEDQAGGEAN